jgi:hypothetical protein
MTCLTRCTMRIVGDNHQVFHHPEVLLNHQHSYCQRYYSTINTHIDGNHSSRYNSRGINSRLMTMSHVTCEATESRRIISVDLVVSQVTRCHSPTVYPTFCPRLRRRLHHFTVPSNRWVTATPSLNVTFFYLRWT